MAKTVKEIITELSDLNVSIQKILYHTDFENYDDLSVLDIDYTNAEELFLVDELRGILDKLSDVSHNLKYLELPIKAEGVLHKNHNGRYEFNGIELCSGHCIEFLSNDDLHCQYNKAAGEYTNIAYWCSSRIEHNGQDYYIVGHPDVELEGLRVRIRRS